MDEEDSVSVYEMMLSWLTPSCLFIIVNLVIGTIVVTSRFACNRKQKLDSSTQPVCSNSSFLERLTSFGFCSYKCVETQAMVEPVQNQDLNRLDRATSSSLIDQVRSFNLGVCKTEQHQDPDDLTQSQLTQAPSLLERIMSVRLRRSESVKPEPGGENLGSGTGSEPEIVDGKGEDESVDAKADDFIKRFKQQLRLERLDSILRCREIFQRN